MSETNSTIVIDVDAYLGHYDNDYSMQVLPAIMCLGLLMLVGVIGNSLVCYVYIWKLKRSTARCFIVALAVYDLITCLISIAIEIADMRHRYTFGNYTLCKVGKVLVHFSTVASGTVLLAVAVDRYRKICTPLQSQVTVELSKIVIIVCSLSVFIYALGTGFIYGGKTVITDNININGSVCFIADEYAGTIYPLIYTGVQFLIFLSATVTLSVLYSLIWRQASWQQTFRNNIETGPKTKRSEKGVRKTTLMLFLITLVFVLSYFPLIGLMTARAVNKDVYVGLKGAELAAYNLFTRSYFINSASNPIIYSFCNELFRRELKKLGRTITCQD